MQIIYSNEVAFDIPQNVATVGFFDGVHSGHRFLIEELTNTAKTQKIASMVITFNTHPRKVLHTDFQPNLLTTLEEKLTIFADLGIDYCYVLDFNLQIAKYTADEFLRNVLFNKLNVRCLLVGHDHRFGHNRAEGFEEYKNYGNAIGMEVMQAVRFSTVEFPHISSSDARKALQIGDIKKANHILQYNYKLSGKVIDGFKVGRKIGFPTANIKPENADKIIPAMGVYAVEVVWNYSRYKGMMNIGQRPTLNNGLETSLEVHIFNFEQQIYNEIIEVRFVEKMRDEKKFDNVDELIKQLEIDKTQVTEKLNQY